MSEIWDNLIEIQNFFIDEFDSSGVRVHEKGMDKFNNKDWVNLVWTSDNYRRAHLDVVDARQTRGLWMMHCCIFPHINNDGPIFGFDIIAGKNKITGAFHDFSPSVNSEHEMMQYFSDTVGNLDWKKERELPEWAKQIFSNDMVAAGNIKEISEVMQLKDLAIDTTKYYISTIGNYNGYADDLVGIKSQNHYAHFQKQNPHTPKTMIALGLNEEDVKEFVEICLFPEINEDDNGI